MRSRVVTGIVLLLSALALVFAAPPLVGWAASLFLGFLGGLELAALVAPRRDGGMALALGAFAAILAGTLPAGLALGATVVGTVALLAAPGRSWLATLGGLAWLGGGLAGVRILAETHPFATGLWDPRPIVLLLLLPIWAADTFAYFGGRAFGRRLLAPRVSPKKTVEGAAAGLVAAMIVGALAGLWLGRSVGVGLFVGLLAATLGPAGDLLESLLKRRVDAKDSGTLLPGHGGVLDRIDSLLLVAPVAALVLAR